MDLREYCHLAGLTPHQAAQLTGKTDRQWRRYLTGNAPLPDYVITLIDLKTGQLGRIHAAWKGWQLHPLTGQLIDPYGRTYSHTWHETLHWHFQRLQATRARLRQKIRDLEKQIEKLSPGDIPEHSDLATNADSCQ